MINTKYGNREAVDLVFKAKSEMTIGSTTFAAMEPVLYFDSVKTSTTEVGATTVYARGGKGNNRLIAWEGDKEVMFNFEDALISQTALAILSGADLLKASASDKITVRQPLIVDGTVSSNVLTTADFSADLDGTFVSTDIFAFLMEDGEKSERLGAPTSGDETGLVFDTDATDGAVSVFIDLYIEVESGATQISISPEKFAGYFYAEGDTLFRNEKGVDVASRLVIPNLKLQTALNFTMSGTGDPSTFSFNADAFPGLIKGGNTKTLYAIQMMA